MSSERQLARVAAALLAALLASACFEKTPLESTTSTIVVHAVLNAAQDDQLVEVQRTTNGYLYASPVNGAAVTITGPDGVAMAGAAQTGTGIYHVLLSLNHESIIPGGTYHLRVRLPTGDEVTGATTVPNAQPSLPPFAIVPFNDATDTLRIDWPRVPGASSYEVRVQSTKNVYALFADTSVALPGMLKSLSGTPVFALGLDHVVLVSAVDEAYYQYYRTNSDPFTGAAVQGNLTGAQGVFGSIVEVTARGLHVATAR